MTMEFNERQSIYLQIVEYVEDHILDGSWKPEERIPSVRDLAVELQVNPNTVMRSYDQLQQRGMIQNRRGVGNFISSDAIDRILKARKEQFLGQDLPHFFRKLMLMNIDAAELTERYRNYVQDTPSIKNPVNHEKE